MEFMAIRSYYAQVAFVWGDASLIFDFFDHEFAIVFTGDSKNSGFGTIVVKHDSF